jgi:hypothetical protein
LSTRAPRSSRRRRGAARAALGGASTNPDEISPATREESLPFALAGVLLSLIALLVSFSRGYLLLYGDAVAHLGIARRILDSRNPGLVQLGGVWLPLPHLLILPFVQKMEWWQNGLAGAWPSLICFILSIVGFYRLCRQLLVPRWAVAATLFFALNPNLLYLATTAMTESLFLALLIWTTLTTVECVEAIRGEHQDVVGRRLMFIGLLVLASVYTRYDGWILGAIVWSIVTFSLMHKRDLWRRVAPGFVVFTLLVIAGPIGWLAYNQHFFHDPLDFIRGPYSAAAIEKKTSAAGTEHYHGWHDPFWAMVYYTRTVQLDAAFWETGFLVMAAAIGGVMVAVRRRLALPALVLWMPLFFYIYSVAYGSVPIFIPPLWPHSYYNSRYGVEMLPALALFGMIAVAWVEVRWSQSQPMVRRLMQPIVLLLIALNALGMMRLTPLVLQEAMNNSTTRVAFEGALARQLRTFPKESTILMYNSDHVGALQQASIPLRQTLNEGDYDSFHAALAAPANHAAYVVAVEGDPVSNAVKAHPEGLTELTILCTSGQPCARIYQSDRLAPAAPKLN